MTPRSKSVLITGAARRIGADCARFLHERGFNVCLHYRKSEIEALALCRHFNAVRAGSAVVIKADLLRLDDLRRLALEADCAWDGIDALVNNASSFYPGPFGQVTDPDWETLLGCNLKAPFFLSQALLSSLRRKSGCIVNLIDIHAERGLPGYPVYTIAKAGLAAMTRTLAKELGPSVRVNGIAPGAILWPEKIMSDEQKQTILDRVPLNRCGDPVDIAKALFFLINDADYMTGQIIAIDGGRSLFS